MSEQRPLPGRGEWDGLAAEYALGSLSGDELAAAETLSRREPAFALTVVEWHHRLAPLVDALPAISPPAQVLERIERILPAAEPDPVGRFAASLLRRVNVWRHVAAAFAVAAIALAMVVARPELIHAPDKFVAVLGEGEQSPRFLVTVDLASRQVSVVAVQGIQPHGGDLQLWLVRSDTGPKSLGLIPTSGEARLDLGAQASPALLTGGLLAVSQEPKGGSPTGLPTGPVVFTGPLLQAPE
jgi:anti-sigma-K factor RskA